MARGGWNACRPFLLLPLAKEHLPLEILRHVEELFGATLWSLCCRFPVEVSFKGLFVCVCNREIGKGREAGEWGGGGEARQGSLSWLGSSALIPAQLHPAGSSDVFACGWSWVQTLPPVSAGWKFFVIRGVQSKAEGSHSLLQTDEVRPAKEDSQSACWVA